MDRNQAKEFFPIMQAYAEGRVIECRTKPSAVEGTDVPNDWTEIKDISFWNNTEYRIKAEPTYRPFANAEECWEEMMKHQPFGWVKKKDTQSFLLCKTVGKFTSAGMENSPYTYDDAFEFCTFADDAPFGVKEE